MAAVYSYINFFVWDIESVVDLIFGIFLSALLWVVPLFFLYMYIKSYIRSRKRANESIDIDTMED